jgi:hypothetical protein
VRGLPIRNPWRKPVTWGGGGGEKREILRSLLCSCTGTSITARSLKILQEYFKDVAGNCRAIGISYSTDELRLPAPAIGIVGNGFS